MYTGAHPRVCGENIRRLAGVEVVDGSSPRVRGKPIAPPSDNEGIRLIPACAGKTFAAKVPTLIGRAHPRVCGENPDELGTKVVGAGSSPRVRGKRPLHVQRL